MELDTLNEGEYIHDFVGPLGVPTHTEGLKKVAVVGGGVGCAIAYPIAKEIASRWVQKFIPSWDSVIRIWLFLRMSSRVPVINYVMMTDDGSYGEKGLVTDALGKIDSGRQPV